MNRTISGHRTAAQRSTAGPRESRVQHFFLKVKAKGMGLRVSGIGRGSLKSLGYAVFCFRVSER